MLYRDTRLSIAALLAGACAIGGMTSSAAAQLLADSVADFSGVQGQANWYYGYYDGDASLPYTAFDFEPLPEFTTIWRRSATAYYTAITPMGQVPNGAITSGGRTPEENWAVRRWISDSTSIVRISGQVWDRSTGSGDGVEARIIVGALTVYQHIVNEGETTPFNFSFEACIGDGTAIDFAIAPRANDFADDTGFTATITSVLQSGPTDVRTCSGGSATFSVVVNGVGPFFYQWRRNGVLLPTGRSATLTLNDVGPADVGEYDCLISNDCGVMSGGSASLTLCRADFNCDQFANSQDFFDFLTAFFAQAPSADFNDDDFVNSQDFFDFITAFFAGCPA